LVDENVKDERREGLIFRAVMIKVRGQVYMR